MLLFFSFFFFGQCAAKNIYYYYFKNRRRNKECDKEVSEQPVINQYSTKNAQTHSITLKPGSFKQCIEFHRQTAAGESALSPMCHMTAYVRRRVLFPGLDHKSRAHCFIQQLSLSFLEILDYCKPIQPRFSSKYQHLWWGACRKN